MHRSEADDRTVSRTSSSRELRRVLVIGTGLIGTSLALALQATGVEVLLADRDHDAVLTAIRRGAGRAASMDTDHADLVVVAVPPRSVRMYYWKRKDEISANSMSTSPA